MLYLIQMMPRCINRVQKEIQIHLGGGENKTAIICCYNYENDAFFHNGVMIIWKTIILLIGATAFIILLS